MNATAQNDIQNKRWKLAALCEDLANTADAAESQTYAAEELCDFPIQREMLLPARAGETTRFQVGRLRGGKWKPVHVEATLDNDAWLLHGEGCADCGHELPAQEDDAESAERAGRIECGRCHAVYATDVELWRDFGDTRVCTECDMTVEADDGGPTMCFACRRKNGIPTICSGCGMRHDAEPMHPSESARACEASCKPPKELRLCNRCTQVARSGMSIEEMIRPHEEFRAAAEAYGSIGQAIESVLIAEMLEHDPKLPQTREMSGWTREATEAATRWIAGQLAMDAAGDTKGSAPA